CLQLERRTASQLRHLRKTGTGGPPVRLTTDAAADTLPSWSPDGNWIAFRRNKSVMLDSPLGGAERKLVDLGATDEMSAPADFAWAQTANLSQSAWSAPDSTASGSIRLEKERLTTPPSTDFGDSSPAFLPNGRALVF